METVELKEKDAAREKNAQHFANGGDDKIF